MEHKEVLAALGAVCIIALLDQLKSNSGQNQTIQKLDLIIQKQDKMEQELAKLSTEVGEVKTVQQSAITLLNGLSEQLRARAGDKAAVLALANDLDSSSNELAEAVAANTPAGETTEPGEEAEPTA